MLYSVIVATTKSVCFCLAQNYFFVDRIKFCMTVLVMCHTDLYGLIKGGAESIMIFIFSPAIDFD